MRGPLDTKGDGAFWYPNHALTQIPTHGKQFRGVHVENKIYNDGQDLVSKNLIYNFLSQE